MDNICSDSFSLKNEDEKVRIDKLLTERYKSRLKSRSYFQYLIENGFVSVNGKVIKKRIIPKTNDLIDITFSPLPEPSLEPQDIKLDIIYEDEEILVINKPQNMVVHPAPGNWDNTFVNALLYHCKNMENPTDSLRPGIVHRLDKDTTGVLIAAKTDLSHRLLIDQFSSRSAIKTYLAICLGSPKDQTIDVPIGRHKIKRKEMTIDPSGKKAVTDIKNICSKNNLSLLEVNIKTGRTHQIRVHLKSINAPILGDNTYGNIATNKKYGVETQLLHAYKLKIVHPTKKINMEFIAPLPKDLNTFIKKNISPKNSEVDIL